MSEAVNSEQAEEQENRRPGQFNFDKAGEIPDPSDVPLEEINVVNPRLFQENKMWGFFERLRKEDPVHLQRIRDDRPLLVADPIRRHQSRGREPRAVFLGTTASPWACPWTRRCRKAL